jgi:hypothetical protein
MDSSSPMTSSPYAQKDSGRVPAGAPFATHQYDFVPAHCWVYPGQHVAELKAPLFDRGDSFACEQPFMLAAAATETKIAKAELERTFI